MRRKKTIAMIGVALLFIFFLISDIKKDLWEVNEDLLKEKVLSIEQTVNTINLIDVTPFEWDVVYSFDPYTSKEMVYSTVGYKWDNIRETVSEGMDQIVFLNDGKVVCYLYGYPANNGYSINFLGESYNKVASVLHINGNLEFHVNRSGGIIRLENY